MACPLHGKRTVRHVTVFGSDNICAFEQSRRMGAYVEPVATGQRGVAVSAAGNGTCHIDGDFDVALFQIGRG